MSDDTKYEREDVFPYAPKQPRCCEIAWTAGEQTERTRLHAVLRELERATFAMLLSSTRTGSHKKGDPTTYIIKSTGDFKRARAAARKARAELRSR